MGHTPKMYYKILRQIVSIYTLDHYTSLVQLLTLLRPWYPLVKFYAYTTDVGAKANCLLQGL